MQYDKVIKIATAPVRTAKVWPLKEVIWSTFIGELRTPAIGTETLEQYTLLDKKTQDQLKDVGGFVGGTFHGDSRKSKDLIARSILVLDLDNVPSGETQTVIDRVESLGYGYVIHSTRKHHAGAPRLRVIMALDRECTPDEYEPLSRKIGELIGIEYCDPTTFQPNRLMFYPSCCADSEYVYQWKDAPFVYVDGTLALYTAWRDFSSWPHSASDVIPTARLGAHQTDPRMKTCIVGAFCRTYDIHQAIATFLPDVYEYFDDERYTHVGGETTGGAWVRDEGVFMYSFHATDPTSRKLVNAFDLVRIHKFGYLDVDVSAFGPNSHTNPSHEKMRDFASGIPEISEELRLRKYSQSQGEFGEFDETFLKNIPTDKKGKIIKDSRTVLYFLNADPKLKGVLSYDEFSNRCMVLKCPPWQTKKFLVREAEDADLSGLNVYLLNYGFKDRISVKEAWQLYWMNTRHNPLQDYLSRVEWDGVPRAEKLFIDYFGAEDCRYVRRATRMWLVGAVTRGFIPGCKFDLMVILIGIQGTGKSEFIVRLSNGWGMEDMKSFKGNKPVENIQGKWLVEVSEISAMADATVEEAKTFIAQRQDTIRFPYARMSGSKPRMCCFIGTSNKERILRDRTGNRRYLPISTEKQPCAKDFTKVDGELDQIWAEVVTWYKAGEKAYYDRKDPDYELIEAAQEEHREEGFYEPMVLDFLHKKVRKNWDSVSLAERIDFWNRYETWPEDDLEERDRICAHEVWFELLRGGTDRVQRNQIREINDILENVKGWKKQAVRCGYLSVVKGFAKC